MKDGVPARDVYQHVVNYVKEKKPDMEKHLPKNFGWGVRLLRCLAYTLLY